MIPEWLSVKDTYVPKEEKSTYIEKSIFSLIKTLSIIRQSKSRDKLIYSLNPTLKVLSTIVLIICISLSRSQVYLLVIDMYALANLLFMEKKIIKMILCRSLIFPIITLIALIPSMLYGNIYNSLMLFQKIIVTILLMNLMSHTTKWSEVSKSLKLLFVPDIFIWIMDITIKYIVLLGEHSIDLLYALKLRSVGKAPSKYNYLTGIMGNLFIKAYKMSEEMFQAMECRGFVGEYTTKVNLKFRKLDCFYLIITLTLVGLFIYCLKR
ncbi:MULTISPECIES: energy-coupling factor transporter transmembrane component T [Clostridium]|uniref:energy-coupling factor transporter transmembrane component T n=1 Tax=Clostridium TaxID=1485 RepID=UPI00069CEB37|nr:MULTISPECIES: energy-coupling factor transporter transmembrane component T [Clostridium]KOF55680.1 cobalt permease [Clostridium sp. DMHC 10]MCD2347667.1 energy-coupling factor transporter transmembrane protein EcfT [Clostridium guangxiense]